MSRQIFAKFSDVDSAERAARTLRRSILSRHIEKLTVTRRAGDGGDGFTMLAAPLGLMGYPPYYGGIFNGTGIPFGNQYGPIAMPAQQPEPAAPESGEAVMRISCEASASGNIHGKLLSLGAYEISVR